MLLLGYFTKFLQKNFFHLTKNTKIRKFGVYRKILPSIYTKDASFRFATVFT